MILFRTLFALLSGLWLAFPLVAQSPASASSPAKVRVTIVVTLEDSPCSNAKILIKPLAAVEAWPDNQPRITLTTDAKGHASLQLGPGKYRATAYDPMRTKLPAGGWFLIKPGQHQPEKLFLNLLYWDCSRVTCLL